VGVGRRYKAEGVLMNWFGLFAVLLVLASVVGYIIYTEKMM
jgi:hypothetical protein